MKSTLTDPLGTVLEISEKAPQKIISLVPSQTELLHDLGLEDEVIGITKFCIHPNSWYRKKKRIGGTKRLRMEMIRELGPDLILANKEENTQEEIEILQSEFNVYTSDVHDLNTALKMIREVGTLTHRLSQAELIIEKVETSFNTLSPSGVILKGVYLIWRNPIMLSGRATFINDMLKRIGIENMAAEASRYPEIDIKTMQKMKPDVVLLSSEPFPFSEVHRIKFQELLPDSRVILVDGEMFSWYGSRLIQAPDYFRRLMSEWV